MKSMFSFLRFRQLALLVLVVGSVVRASDGPDTPFPIPAGLQQGDSFRLVFTTAGRRDALSGEVADYDSFVQAAADAAGIGSDVGITWKAIISMGDSNGPTIHARDRVVVGEATPVYNTRLDLVASGFADLWDGGIANPINSDEFGAGVQGDSWTGSQEDGFADPELHPGSDSERAWCGAAGQSNGRWIRNVTPRKTTNLHLIAISEVLSVPEIPPPPRISIDGASGLYEQNFDSMGVGGANEPLPTGWAVVLDDTFRFCETSRSFPLTGLAFSGIFSAGGSDAEDRALGILASSTLYSLECEVDVEGSAAEYAKLSFDIEVWDVSDDAIEDGDVVFTVLAERDSGDGFETVAELGSFSSGAVLTFPKGEILDGNAAGNRFSFETEFPVEAAVGDKLRLRFLSGRAAVTRGWLYGLDNVRVEMTEAPAGMQLQRADCNADGSFDISDPVAVLGYLFLGVARPDCLDACDFDDG
ncbi:MAG: hypothetical protein AAF488_10905, partial [Planctomycetota bacterium]